VKIVKAAEAEAEAKYLAGQGIASVDVGRASVK